MLNSTLFPYTTLFRSDAGLLEAVFQHRLVERNAGDADRLPFELLQARHTGIRRDHDARRAELMRGRDREDRKSTRLNSSHLVISYAVFCLKKKKKVKI